MDVLILCNKLNNLRPVHAFNKKKVLVLYLQSELEQKLSIQLGYNGLKNKQTKKHF